MLKYIKAKKLFDGKGLVINNPIVVVKDNYIKLKRELIDQDLLFNDGTCFNGDKFRLDKIIEKQLDNKEIKVKLIDSERIHYILRKVKIQEIYQFYIESPFLINTDKKHIKIQIEEVEQILKMIW